MHKIKTDNAMEINLTLVSTKRTLLISIVGIFILISLVVISSTLRGLQPFLFIAIIVIGGLGIYFPLKYFARFVDKVVINQDYIRVGDKYTIYWDSIKSYQYSNTGLLVGFVFRTNDDRYELTGLLRGTQGENFKIIQDRIVKIIDEWNSNPNKNKIMPFEYNSSKAGKRGIFITMIICITGLLIASYFMIVSHKKIKPELIFKFGILCFMTLIAVIQFITNRK